MAGSFPVTSGIPRPQVVYDSFFGVYVHLVSSEWVRIDALHTSVHQTLTCRPVQAAHTNVLYPRDQSYSSSSSSSSSSSDSELSEEPIVVRAPTPPNPLAAATRQNIGRRRTQEETGDNAVVVAGARSSHGGRNDVAPVQDEEPNDATDAMSTVANINNRRRSVDEEAASTPIIPGHRAMNRLWMAAASTDPIVRNPSNDPASRLAKMMLMREVFWPALVDHKRRTGSPWQTSDLLGMLSWYRWVQSGAATATSHTHDGVWRDLHLTSPWALWPDFDDLLWEATPSELGPLTEGMVAGNMVTDSTELIRNRAQAFRRPKNARLPGAERAYVSAWVRIVNSRDVEDDDLADFVTWIKRWSPAAVWQPLVV